MMNFQDFPVVDTEEFKMVMVDAIQWADDTYTMSLNFIKELGNASEGKESQGFCWTTHMSGSSLEEILYKSKVMISLGIFDGCEVMNQGMLWNAKGEIVSDIDWEYYEKKISKSLSNTFEPTEIVYH